MTPEYKEALAKANETARPANSLPGLGGDDIDIRANLMAIQANTCDHATEFLAQSRHSFADVLTGGDGLGPWND